MDFPVLKVFMIEIRVNICWYEMLAWCRGDYAEHILFGSFVHEIPEQRYSLVMQWSCVALINV